MARTQVVTEYRLTELSVFSMLWAASSLFEQNSCLCIQHQLLAPVPQVLGYTNLFSFVIACALILRPHSTPLLYLLALTNLLSLGISLPHAPNHFMIRAFVDINLLLYFFRYRKSKSPERIFRKTLPSLRLVPIILYCFAVFHKLNWDFINPKTSCSSMIYGNILENLDFLPKSNFLLSVFPHLTLTIELGIALLLLFRPTRSFAIIIGLLFHFGLTFDDKNHYFDFSSVMFSLLMLFVPLEFFEKLTARLKHLQLSPSLLRKIFICAAVSVWLSGLFFVLGLNQNLFISLYLFLRQAIWWLSALALIFSYLLIKYQTSELALKPRTALGWLIPALMIFNGLTPYLGIKTRSSFDMYSNLRIEGGRSNHFLMPPSLDVFGNLKDLVTILETSNAELKNKFVDAKYKITFHELKRYVQTQTAFSIKYQLGGQEIALENSKTSAELNSAIPFLKRKLVSYRPIDALEEVRCQW